MEEKTRNHIFSEIIDASISDIATTHRNVLNDLIDRDFGERPAYKLSYTVICACKSVLSVFYSARLIFRKKLPSYAGKRCVLIYSPNNKTIKEAVSVTEEVLHSMNYNSLILTDDEIMDSSRPASKILLKEYQRINLRTFIEILRKFYSGLKHFLFIDRRWLRNIVLISNYANSARGEFFINELINTYEVKCILNFFSATTFGRQLNTAGLRNNVKVFTYSWGSNMKALEQEYTKQDVLLLKYELEKVKYPEHTYGRSKVVGDITAVNCNETKKGIERKYLLFLDTCYSCNFGRNEKEELVKKAFQSIDNSLFVVFKWHPASQDRESLRRQIESIHNNISFVSEEYDINCLISWADAVININSTLLVNCIELNKTTINLFPLFCEMTGRPATEDYDFMVNAPVHNVKTFDQMKTVIDLYKRNAMPAIQENALRDYRLKYLPYMGAEAVKNIVKEIRAVAG